MTMTQAAPVSPVPAAPPAPRRDLWLEDSPEDPGAAPYDLRRFLRELAIAATVLAVGLPLVLLVPGDAPATTATVTTAAAPARPVLVLSGAGLGGAGAQGVVDTLGRTGSVLTSPGAGWASGLPSLTSLIAERRHDPSTALVVIQGGEADAALPPARVELAAAQLADRVRAAFSPSTAIVFVGPVATGASTDAALPAVRDALAAAAQDKSVHFVDPLAEGWAPGTEAATQLAETVRPYLPG